MRAKTRTVYGVPALVLLLVVLWNERFSYWISTFSWPTHDENGRNCDRILLVADPQLLGYKQEKYGAIARWDSDRYLANGFSQAKANFKPDSIFFLGDLFDEGVTAEKDEWNDTYERFVSIFPIGKEENAIYIAGDNDIGGEAEPIDQNARNTFNHYFRNNLTRIKEIYSIYETYLFEPRNIKTISEKSDPKARIMLTHVPYLLQFRGFTDVGDNMDLILSAHDHTTSIMEIQRSPPKALMSSTVSDVSPTYIKSIGPNEPLIEIKVPTCSYRMGVPEMGYGILSICQVDTPYPSTQIQFSMYWLPSRFRHLYIYLFALVFSVIWIVYHKMRRRKQYAWLE